MEFLEDQEKVKGKGPDWIFDLDVITPSMNYVPLRKENQVVHEDDEQYIVHDVPVSSNNDLVKEPEAEKKKVLMSPKKYFLRRIKYLKKNSINYSFKET